jgi:hypothetical protein
MKLAVIAGLVLLLSVTRANAEAWTCSYLEKIDDNPATSEMMRFEVDTPNLIVTAGLEDPQVMDIIKDDDRALVATASSTVQEQDGPVVYAATVAINKANGQFTYAALMALDVSQEPFDHPEHGKCIKE